MGLWLSFYTTMFIRFLRNTHEPVDRGITTYPQERKNMCIYNLLKHSRDVGQGDMWFPYKTLSFHLHKSSTGLLQALNSRFSGWVRVDPAILENASYPVSTPSHTFSNVPVHLPSQDPWFDPQQPQNTKPHSLFEEWGLRRLGTWRPREVRWLSIGF